MKPEAVGSRIESIHFPVVPKPMLLPPSLTLSMALSTEAMIRREGHKKSRNFYHDRTKNLSSDLYVFTA